MVSNIVVHVVTWQIVNMKLFKFCAWWFMWFHVMVVYADMVVHDHMVVFELSLNVPCWLIFSMTFIQSKSILTCFCLMVVYVRANTVHVFSLLAAGCSLHGCIFWGWKSSNRLMPGLLE